ncbi:heterokaryon incompatibility protein-domain-containing protein [Cladorrhinum samala]|uniref:Heterokaryon incompatibility protein-domain-containing protein n=1 Tax=Cladorrhinum samala TaxID=585594 RepID=A0AAV9HE14_9PEZI|nr:heterokaryon incompatibility protein-domain-containing protein [Cladorrhinum samala]
MGQERPTKRLRLDVGERAEEASLTSLPKPQPEDTHASFPQALQLLRPCEECRRLLPACYPEDDEVQIGNFKDWIRHRCSFAELILAGVKLAWGPMWDSSTTSRLQASNPPIFYKLMGCVVKPRTGGGTYLDSPRLLLAIGERPPHITLSQTGKRTIDNLVNRHIIAEVDIDCFLGGGSPLRRNIRLEYPARQPVGAYFDCSIAKQWLADSSPKGQGRKATPPHDAGGDFWSDPGFRLIDVENQCLVLEKKPCEYAALSYLWGTAAASQSLQLLHSNAAQLSEPGALGPRQSQPESLSLPIARTIQDAIVFVKNIGQRFLWVDSLCIIQDDSEEKQRLIHGMDQVYERASLTIIAVAGVDADAGLAGITPRQSLPYEKLYELGEVAEGKRLSLAICRPSLTEQIRNSRWNSRGWTYQEQCLSHRCVYFTPDEVFFVSQKCHWREGYDWDDSRWRKPKGPRIRTGPPWWNSTVKRDPDPSPYQPVVGVNPALGYSKFERMVKEFCRKDLTFPGDVLNAFQGIVNRFCPSNSGQWVEHCQNMPLHFLPPLLLWYPMDRCAKRVIPPTNTCNMATQATALSSWSWASWSGPVDFAFANNKGLTDGMAAPTIAFELWNARSYVVTWLQQQEGGSRSGRGPFEVRPDIMAAVMDSKTTPSPEEGLSCLINGILLFSAPYLAISPTFTWTQSRDPSWKFSLPGVDWLNSSRKKDAEGNFRFDEMVESDQPPAVSGLIALIRGVSFMVMVLGVRELSDGSYIRIGIGSVCPVPNSRHVTLDWLEGSLGFEWRQLRLK